MHQKNASRYVSVRNKLFVIGVINDVALRHVLTDVSVRNISVDVSSATNMHFKNFLYRMHLNMCQMHSL